VLAEVPQVHSASVTARCGNRIVFDIGAAVTLESAVEADLEDRKLLGEVVNCVARGDRFELWVEVQHSISRSWQPHPAWRGEDAPDSVLNSLCALNEHLLQSDPHEAEIEDRNAVFAHRRNS
jgi:hypothetical protein